MVSYKGFQKGAILQAKEASIELFEFRELKEEDLNDKNVLQILLKLKGYTPNFKVLNMDRKIIDPILIVEEKSEFNNEPLELRRNQNDFLYNDKGVYIGSFLEFLNKIYFENMANFYLNEENIKKIDLEEYEYNMRQEWNEKNIFFKILRFNLVINFTEETTEFIIGSNKIQDWFLLKNITLDKSKLIHKSVATNIQKKYTKNNDH